MNPEVLELISNQLELLDQLNVLKASRGLPASQTR
jgi:hypothetical protein